MTANAEELIDKVLQVEQVDNKDGGVPQSTEESSSVDLPPAEEEVAAEEVPKSRKKSPREGSAKKEEATKKPSIVKAQEQDVLLQKYNDLKLHVLAPMLTVRPGRRTDRDYMDYNVRAFAHQVQVLRDYCEQMDKALGLDNVE